MAQDPLVFISYARLDGEPFANELKQRIIAEPGVALWQDRISMGPGDFEQQIREAIDSARYLVLVVTPGAMRSEWVEKEWRYARENGVCICPIKPSFHSEEMGKEFEELWNKLPRWIRKTQRFDFEGYWELFVRALKSPCQATRVPFLAPGLPANFVKRPLESSRIIDGLLDAEHKNPSGKNVVLYGSGGFGKTTLALNVCHHEDIFTAYDGGILWATLGEQPSPIEELTKIYAALTPKGERPQFATLEDARVAVAQKLAGKSCLIVIDDVWEDEHLAPFLDGGDKCARLINTRRFNLAVRQVDDPSRRINVAELKPDEALELLAARLDPPSALVPRFRQLAARLGEWPMLVQLVNGAMLVQVALGDTVEGALDWANAEFDRMGVMAFDREDAKAREQAIGKSVELSLGLLEQDRARCLELGIFPEDTEIPLEPIGLVWRTNEGDTLRLAKSMQDLALIRLDLSRKPGETSRGSVRIHDVMRSYFAAQLADAASLHARLADAWKDPRRLAGAYARQYVTYHIGESMADPNGIIERGRQLINLLTDSRYREYRERHSDPATLHRHILLALRRASEGTGPDSAALVAALAVVEKSYAGWKHNPEVFFKAAVEGRRGEAVQRLDLMDAEQEWKTAARLVIAWVAPPEKAVEAAELTGATAAACDRPELQTLLSWVETPPGTVPNGLPVNNEIPDPYKVTGILQRAGGAETLVSGLIEDASGFIADQDGPVLVAFAKLDPASNSRFLERYIEIHASNRYRYYRNRSLWALMKWVLAYPDAEWVRNFVQKMVTAALTVTEIDFEEVLPLSVLGLKARFGDELARTKLDAFRQRLIQDAARLGAGGTTAAPPPSDQPGDSWSHYQRRACALAEIYALALDDAGSAWNLLQLARALPKGFAGFRAFSALTLAESTEIVAPLDRAAMEAGLESAQAASHRIQDYPFCLQTTAMVNAMRINWWNLGFDPDKLEAFASYPMAEEFCSVHRVLDDFHYRYSDSNFQSLPIPQDVLGARTLAQIADAYRRRPELLGKVNGWFRTDQQLNSGETVNIPEPAFTPILAARFSAAVLVAPGLTDAQRSGLIQRLVPLALTNRTALDTILARLLLSAGSTKFEIPALLDALEVPGAAALAASAERLVG